MTWVPGTAKAVARSFGIYYRDAARTARMDALNARILSVGDLAFDIGAHVGDRTDSYRRLGASVVVVEPQPALHRALRLLFRNDPGVTLHRAAVGAEKGKVRFYVNSANPMTSTAARPLIEAAPQDPAWSDQVWDQHIETEVITLDALITRHGKPALVKIDVEGFEVEVLRGLALPIATVVFEFTTLQRAVGLEAVERLAHLGNYRFNYSLGETHRLLLDAWTDADGMAAILAAIPSDANSGDIYACLRHP